MGIAWILCRKKSSQLLFTQYYLHLEAVKSVSGNPRISPFLISDEKKGM